MHCLWADLLPEAVWISAVSDAMGDRGFRCTSAVGLGGLLMLQGKSTLQQKDSHLSWADQVMQKFHNKTFGKGGCGALSSM